MMIEKIKVFDLAVEAVQLAALVWLMWAVFRWSRLFRDELDELEANIEALWRRAEWLERDADGRLSADRVELQQRGMQIRQVQKRVRRCEKALYINVDGSEAEGKEEDAL